MNHPAFNQTESWIKLAFTPRKAATMKDLRAKTALFFNKKHRCM